MDDESKQESEVTSEVVVDIKPKKKVGRPTKEEALAKRRRRGGRKPGSKNKSKELMKKAEAYEMSSRYIKEALEKIAALMRKDTASDTIQLNAARELVERGFEAIEYLDGMEKPKVTQGTTGSSVVTFPFAVKK